ncbi:carbohydrate ABC transporter permease [Antribacter gilvus]|uniref:carbohydrate ABC transporter permease n=1 Tax=Antribacter gilvus TaxID=2304675 RepID=UPI000F7840BF|nr:sugar ABC transporter permease [Antribacter gilvus]
MTTRGRSRVARAGVPPRSSLARAEARAGLGLVLPSVVIVVVLVVAPILWSLLLAFKDLRLVELARAPLFGDFSTASIVEVLSSRRLWESMGATFAYSVIGTAGAIVVGLVAALALRKPFRGRGLVRALLLLPYVAPIVATTFAWRTLLNPQYGLVNAWGQALLGWERPVAFLTQRSAPVGLFGLELTVPVALSTVIAFEVWRTFPFAFLFLTARLEALPGDIEEAARMDGATPTQSFRHIVWPQLVPIVAVLTVLRFIWTFNTFDDVYLLTEGRAGTQVVSVGVYNYLVGRGDVGAASAQALLLAIVLAVLIAAYLRLAGRRGGES